MTNPSPSSFYNQNATVYTDTNPPGPVDAPLVNTPSPAPSSMYNTTGPVLTSMAEANFTVAISVAGGQILASEWLYGFTFDFGGSFPANFTGSQATARVGATNPTTLTLLKNGVQFATLTFTGTTGAFSGSQMVFVAGDVLELVGPASADGTLAHLAISLLGARNS